MLEETRQETLGIVLDIDGVLAEFEEAACIKFGTCDRSLYSLELRWPNQKGEIHRFVGDPLTYLRLRPIRDSVFATHLLSLLGFKLIVVTARPPSLGMWLVTKLWLWWHGISHKKLIVTSFEKKVGIIASLNPVFAVDDSPTHLKTMSERGIKAIAFDQPWNQEYKGARVANWLNLLGQIYRLVNL